MAETLHATCVAYQGHAVLITGASGQGKSSLGMQLMALGCDLVADDRTHVALEDGHVIARCPATLRGLIEARGIGILNATPVVSAMVAVVVDLNQTEMERMPQRRHITIAGCDLPLIWRSDGATFPAAILQILKSGWSDR